MRDYGEIARIEIPSEELSKLFDMLNSTPWTDKSKSKGSDL